ncbi:MAG: DUF169 domain-containing protein [Bacillota bacterium]|jgi:uncharacterized protein (DUF169 family)
MDMLLKEYFLACWDKYFGKADLPIVFYYTNEETQGNLVEFCGGTNSPCFIGQLNRVRKGEDLRFNAKSVGCRGGLAYLGYQKMKMPNFEYFLSCGIEGKMQGERYKRTPELVLESRKLLPDFEAPASNIVFKRWDRLVEDDTPEVVIFLASPDVLSGLFTLSNFEEGGGLTNVIAPFGSGCSTIITWPSIERAKNGNTSYLGMFDISARPFVPCNTLSLAMPIEKLERIVDCIEESFVITDSWSKVRARIQEC